MPVLRMQPSTGRSRDACDHALTTAVGNAVGGPKGKTGSQGQVHELAIMGAASPASPKGTGNLAAGTASPKRAGAGTTGSPRGQEPASGMEPETHGPALGLTIHRMETTKALEDASPRTADRDDALGEQPLPPAPADEPEGTPERQGEEGRDGREVMVTVLACSACSFAQRDILRLTAKQAWRKGSGLTEADLFWFPFGTLTKHVYGDATPGLQMVPTTSLTWMRCAMSSRMGLIIPRSKAMCERIL